MSPRARAFERFAVGALAVVLAAMAVVYALARVAATRQIAAAEIGDLVAGTAATPFQYRVLLPFVLGRVIALCPGLATRLAELVAVNEALFHLGSTAVVAVYLRARGASVLYGGVCAVLVGLLPFVYLVEAPFRPFYFASDTPGCFFLLSALVCATLRRWKTFAAIVLVGALNRETVVLAVAAAALATLGRHRDGASRRALVVSFAGFVFIKAALYVRYAGNRGAGLFEIMHRAAQMPTTKTHVASNLAALASWPKCGYVVALVILPALAAMAGARRVRDPVLASYGYVAASCCGVYFFIANLDELRAFAEIMLPLALAVAASLGSRPAPRR